MFRSTIFNACIVLALTSTSIEAIRYATCDEDKSAVTVLNVSVAGCETDTCPLYSYAITAISIKFKVNTPVKPGNASVSGNLGGFDFPFQLPNPGVCNNTGLNCTLEPSEKNHTYTYNYYHNVLVSGMTVIVKWQLLDDANEAFLCVRIPVVLAGANANFTTMTTAQTTMTTAQTTMTTAQTTMKTTQTTMTTENVTNVTVTESKTPDVTETSDGQETMTTVDSLTVETDELEEMHEEE